EAAGHDRVGVATALELPAAWRKTMIHGLLSGQRPDGGFGVHPYKKWIGSHWRLVSLVELGVPPSSRAARSAANDVLGWIAEPSEPVVVAGRERRHASMEGNALAVCSRLGMARDARVRHLVDVLLRSQWPDGGSNCDTTPEVRRSSFHESLAPIWGLAEYHRATGDGDAYQAARRAAELLLEGGLFRSQASCEVVHAERLHIHWPHYWHYDYFHGLRAIGQVCRLGDPRAGEALEVLRMQMRPDGKWRAGAHKYWRMHGASNVEVVDWGDAHQVVTPAALAMLQ
ncbi:MAG: hypothetical protein M3R21_05940, partial [Candidatus Dormibacteraeota bacterium]|nr:hypothetical protein [Candidatus Dormibacteraeota bacterium]